MQACFDSGRLKDLPEEYTDFLLMREVYHCTPSEFDEQDDATIEAHLHFVKIQSDQQRIEAKRAEQRAKIKKK